MLPIGRSDDHSESEGADKEWFDIITVILEIIIDK